MKETEKLLEIIREAVRDSELVENPTDEKGTSFSVKIPYGVFKKMSDVINEHKDKLRVS